MLLLPPLTLRFLPFFTAGCLIISGSCSLYAQTTSGDPFEGRNIVSIQYSPGSFLDPPDLAVAQVLKMGNPLHREDVAQSIDSLFATGQFEDISVEAEAVGTGVSVRFVVKPRVFVNNVRFQGKIKSPPNEAELQSYSRLNAGTPFRETSVDNAIGSMNRLFESNGLHDSKIDPQVVYSKGGDQVFITFTLHEPKRAKYEHPQIEGETLLPDSVILRASGWRLPIIHWWREVTQARTNNGARGILSKYQSQNRLTARVDLTQTEYDAATNRVRPHLAITPGPKVEVKAVEAKVSKKILKRYVPVYQERAVDPELLLEGKRNLEDYFQSQGYYDVVVDFRVIGPEKDLETIEYAISKGERRKVVHVAIMGNQYFDVATIRERMFIQPAAFNLRHGRYSEAFRKKDEENITDLYRSNGFRDVKVTTATEDRYKGKAGEIAVTVSIAEGKQWLVSSATIRGARQLQTGDLENQLASTTGQPFAEVNLAGDRETILTYYYEHGFPSAECQPSWRPSGPQRVDVDYVITEGQQQYVRDILIAGARVTRPALIARNITLKAGDPLSPVEQTRIQQNLYDLGIFARVDTAIENPDGTAAHKYILYDFEEANRYSLTVGVGAQVGRFGTPSNTSLAGPAGTTGFSPEFSLDISRLNFLGLGHTISLRTNYSTIENLASLTYLQPRFLNHAGRSISYTLLYDKTLDVRTFASKREQASIQLSQKFSKSLTGMFGVAYRRVSVSDVIIPVLLIPQFVQPVRIGILTANLVQDRRNNPANPSHGMYNTIDVGIATKALASQRSFGRVLARNATYYKLSKSLILARQTEFGVIAPFSAPAGVTEQESVPLPERFFGGGADSLRAFPYNEAGPRDTGEPLVVGGPSSKPTGFPLGGNAIFVNNVELRFPLIGQNIQGVLFHDMGNVFSSVGAISFAFHQRNLQDFNYLVHDAGFGVRYRTPVGPIRLDLAYSINPPKFDGFGGTPQQLLQCNPNAPASGLPSYCQPSQQSISHFQFFFSIGQTF
ncbi:MAG TPA: BamA/TamA family outer membrane protein [Bryobacteraceae bacterium]|nr:BamA/TamA family outer membrane protein [Bryobacteraceae bacterium]